MKAQDSGTHGSLEAWLLCHSGTMVNEGGAVLMLMGFQDSLAYNI